MQFDVDQEQVDPQIPLPEVINEAHNGQSTDNNTLEALDGQFDIINDNEPTLQTRFTLNTLKIKKFRVQIVCTLNKIY